LKKLGNEYDAVNNAARQFVALWKGSIEQFEKGTGENLALMNRQQLSSNYLKKSI